MKNSNIVRKSNINTLIDWRRIMHNIIVLYSLLLGGNLVICDSSDSVDIFWMRTTKLGMQIAMYQLVSATYISISAYQHVCLCWYAPCVKYYRLRIAKQNIYLSLILILEICIICCYLLF